VRASGRRRLTLDERQDELLDAAKRVFERIPYEEVNIASIAREAKISMGLLYHYYSGKRAIFDAVYARLAETVVQACVERAGGEGYRFVSSCLDAYLDYATAHPKAVRMILQPGLGASDAAFNAGLNQRFAKLLATLLHIEKCDVERHVAIAAWLSYVDTSVLAILDGAALDRERFKQSAIRVLKSALR